jgi:1-acyl-sn-glycerol-3-phosphate acyltransferase
MTNLRSPIETPRTSDVRQRGVSPWRRRGVPVVGSGDPPVYAGLRVFCALFVVPLYRYGARGGQHVPSNGGVILAVSHKSWWDPIFTGLALKRPMRIMAKEELFRAWWSRWVVVSLGAYPIKRGRSDVEALHASLDILADGDQLLMFPEGHRYHDDAIHPFHPGIALLAARSGRPVVPMAIRGSKQMAVNKWPRFPRVRVAVGPPVDLSGLQGSTKERHEEAAERARRAVEQLYDSL